jgi:hypothetical protein
MRVKLYARCPYVPQDMADHYDPCAAFHLCARCDGVIAIWAIHDRHDVQGMESAKERGRELCATSPTARSVVLQTGAAPSVAGSLA